MKCPGDKSTWARTAMCLRSALRCRRSSAIGQGGFRRAGPSCHFSSFDVRRGRAGPALPRAGAVVSVISGVVRTQEHESDGTYDLCLQSVDICTTVLGEGLTDAP